MKLVFDARAYLEKIWTLVEKISIDGHASSQFIGSMLFSTLNICDAMQVLIQQRNFVSANILLRPLFEYMFRSFWLNRVASQEETQHAMIKDTWPKTLALHNAIKNKNDVIDLLANEKIKVQDILHSYSHGGSQNPLGQLGNGNYITPNIPDHEVIYLLEMISLISYSSLCEFIHLSRTNEFDSELENIGNGLVRLFNTECSE